MFRNTKVNGPEKNRQVLNRIVTNETFTFDNNATLAIEKSKHRFLNVPILNNKNTNIFIGSTYVKSAGTQHEGSVLDSAYSAYIYNNNQVVGQVIGVADGFGGHHDADEDKYIAVASKVAAEQSCAELAKYNQPEELTDEVIKAIAKETGEMVVKLSKGQSSTLACGRIFRTRDNKFKFVGFGVGDSVIIGWNPVTQQYITVVPGMHVGHSPAPINSYRPEELRIYRLELPEEILLIGMSDGAFETFTVRKPFLNIERRFQLEPDITTINNIFSNLTSANTASDFSDAIINKEIENLNLAPLNGKGVKGDDTTIIVARISEAAFTAALHCVQNLDKVLTDAITKENTYANTRITLDYDAAVLAFNQAIALHRCTEDYIGLIRGLMGISHLTLKYHSNNLFGTIFKSDYRVRAMVYGLEVADILKKLTPEILKDFKYPIQFSNELNNFLKEMLGVAKVVKALQIIEWQNKIPYQECPNVIAAAIDHVQKLTEGMDLSENNNNSFVKNIFSSIRKFNS